MTIVTGGAGFIGSHLVALLHAAGEHVRVIEKPGVSVEHFPSSVEVLFADITDRTAIRSALQGGTHLYHLAADPKLWAPRRGHFHRVNFLGTVNVLEEALAARVQRIVHCSTESILTRSRQTAAITEDQVVPFDDVIGPYCQSKWRAERHAFRLCKQGAPIVVVNPTLPVGPGDRGLSPPTRMLRDFLHGGTPAYIAADLNLIDVRDVALGIRNAMDVGTPGSRYLLGAEAWSVKRIFEFVAEVAGMKPPRYRVPYDVALMTAYVSEFLADAVTKKAPAATITGVKLTRRRMEFDASRSLAALGVMPRPVAEALREAIAEHLTPLPGFAGRGWGRVEPPSVH